MANRFWVGNGGNINDTAHWSATTGGAGGASVPTNVDNAYFDANSFTLTGQTVTVNATFTFLDMDWTGAINSPTLAGASILNCTGSLTLIASMIRTYTGNINFNSATTGKTVTTNGITLASSIDFGAGGSGGWTLQDNFVTTGNFAHERGTLDTNSKSISCADFQITGVNTRILTLGTSVITCTKWTATTTTGLTFNANTSSINQTGSTSFDGGGLTYNIVNFSGATATILSSNTFSTLNQAKGTTLKAASGTTQTITNPVFNGTTASPSTLQSVTAGIAATIALPAGRYFIRHTSIKDITITGATAVTSIAGTNVSGNTGITFVTKFEMGRIKNDGSFNWYSTTTGAVTKVSG